MPDFQNDGIDTKMAEFTELASAAETERAVNSLDQLLDVKFEVEAVLGRKVLTIDEILKLGTGTVVELDRPVAESIDLVVQGVRLARGEVVVVNDCFAIRIKEISRPKKPA